MLNLDDNLITPTPDGEIDEYFDELSIFYKKFSDNLVVFDPLDRPLPDEDSDDAIKRDELIKKLEDMPGIMGFALNAPISKERSSLLDKMFDTEIQACN